MPLEIVVPASTRGNAGVDSAGFDRDGLETAGGAGETGVSSGIVILRATGMLKPGSDKNWTTGNASPQQRIPRQSISRQRA
jgi:hypothetical protein